MPPLFIRFALILITGALAAGCRSGSGFSRPDARASERPPAARDDDQAASLRAEAFARFATGSSYEFNEQFDLALEQYYQSALLLPSEEPHMVELAMRLLQTGQTEKAIDLLQRAAAQPEASGSPYALLGRAHLQAGQTNLALSASQTAIRKTPKLLGGYQNLVEMHLQNGQPAEALKVLDAAAKQKNLEPPFLIGMAELYARCLIDQPREIDQIRPRIVQSLDRAAALKPEHPNLLQRLADNFHAHGENEKAVGLYFQLLEAYSEHSDRRDFLREKLANILLLSDDKSRARELLEALVRDNPTRYPQAYYFLGNLAQDAHDAETAARHYETTLQLAPDLEVVYYELANIHLSRGRTQDALNLLQRAREKFPANFVLEFFSALAHVQLKNFNDAFKHFTAAEIIARATDPTRLNHLFYFQLGAAYERSGNVEEAEKHFEKCIELAPEFAEALNYLGYLWADRGVQLERARELIEKAVRLSPENPAYLDSLGWVLFRLNEPDQALDYLLKAAELLTEPDAVILDHIGDVYHALGQSEEARKYWENSLSVEPNEVIRKKLESDTPTTL